MKDTKCVTSHSTNPQKKVYIKKLKFHTFFKDTKSQSRPSMAAKKKYLEFISSIFSYQPSHNDSINISEKVSCLKI